jgi:ornithine cyclodeaminase/alanine dehydrogenase-like protein (mu-crystallin family)
MLSKPGVLTRDEVHGELADVICGRIASRRNDDEIFVFDSTGTALQDVAVSSFAYARAVERGTGVEVAFTYVCAVRAVEQRSGCRVRHRVTHESAASS